MAGAGRGACPGWATTAAVVVLGAALGTSVAACSGGSGTPSATSSATASALPGDRHGVSGEPHGIIGQISTENSSTWTVTAQDGTRYSVIITPETHFGSPQAPASVQQFPVGSAVRVTGTIADHTITALLITAPGSRHLGSTAPTTSTAPQAEANFAAGSMVGACAIAAWRRQPPFDFRAVRVEARYVLAGPPIFACPWPSS